MSAKGKAGSSASFMSTAKWHQIVVMRFSLRNGKILSCLCVCELFIWWYIVLVKYGAPGCGWFGVWFNLFTGNLLRRMHTDSLGPPLKLFTTV